MAKILDIGGEHKCAYEQCECQVSTLATYCSDYCMYADDLEEIELECDCKHTACSLTDRERLRLVLDQGPSL
jgi:hypothetical protein